MKKLFFAIFAAGVLITTVTGCHTVHGAGKDIESVGDTIQEHTP